MKISSKPNSSIIFIEYSIKGFPFTSISGFGKSKEYSLTLLPNPAARIIEDFIIEALLSATLQSISSYQKTMMILNLI